MGKPPGFDATSALIFCAYMARLVQIIVSPGSAWTGPGSIPTAMFAISIVLLLAEILVVWFFWQGRYWARRLVLAMACVELVQLLHLSQMWSRSHAAASLAVADGVLAAFLLWYLETRAVREWFVQKSQHPASCQ